MRAQLGTSAVIAADAGPLDGELAISAAAVAKAGRKPRARTTDLIIAATAHAHAARLYTRNPGDFAGLGKYAEALTP